MRNFTALLLNGLRDYETAVWTGGDPACDHKGPSLTGGTTTSKLGSGDGTGGRKRSQAHLPPKGRGTQGPQPMNPRVQPVANAPHRGGSRTRTCPKCGATSEDKQIGLEESVDQYIGDLVAVFREVRRVLRDDGLMILNLGDSYNSSPPGNKDPMSKSTLHGAQTSQHYHDRLVETQQRQQEHRRVQPGLAQKNLLGIPWRTALVLQADGWILRSALPWLKRNSMPSSAEDRPGSALEYLFVFAKQPHYYWDMEAVRPRSVSRQDARAGHGRFEYEGKYDGNSGQGQKAFVSIDPEGRNFRDADLWFQSIKAPHGLVGVGDELVGLDVTSETFPGSHFAVFPQALVRPFVLAGTSARGCCPKCGTPWRRVVEKERKPTRPGTNSKVNAKSVTSRVHHDADVVGNRDPRRHCTETKTLGWAPVCACYDLKVIGDQPSEPSKPVHKKGEPTSDYLERYQSWEGKYAAWEGFLRDWWEDWQRLKPFYDKLEVMPCVVLDPFSGAATTALVALKLGRRAVGIELSPKYLKMGYDRLVHRGKVGRDEAPAKKGLFF